MSNRPGARVRARDQGNASPRVADADIALLDLDREWTITNDSVLSKIGWTPYDGRTIRGSVERTLVRGVDVWSDGTVVGQPGHGKQATPTTEP